MVYSAFHHLKFGLCRFPCLFVLSISQCFAFAFVMVHTLNIHNVLDKPFAACAGNPALTWLVLPILKHLLRFALAVFRIITLHCISQLGTHENQAVVGLYIHQCFLEFSGSNTNRLSCFSAKSNTVNFTLEQATKAQRRSRGIALLFL
jgi:hypothetical protein